MAVFEAPWISVLHSFYLAADGLSVLLLYYGLFGVVAIERSGDEVQERLWLFLFQPAVDAGWCGRAFHRAGFVSVFLLLGSHADTHVSDYRYMGHENKNYAAMKFFIFTQVTGMMMLVSILVLAYFHYLQQGSLSFNYQLAQCQPSR